MALIKLWLLLIHAALGIFLRWGSHSCFRKPLLVTLAGTIGTLHISHVMWSLLSARREKPKMGALHKLTCWSSHQPTWWLNYRCVKRLFTCQVCFLVWFQVISFFTVGLLNIVLFSRSTTCLYTSHRTLGVLGFRIPALYRSCVLSGSWDKTFLWRHLRTVLVKNFPSRSHEASQVLPRLHSTSKHFLYYRTQVNFYLHSTLL